MRVVRLYLIVVSYDACLLRSTIFLFLQSVALINGLLSTVDTVSMQRRLSPNINSDEAEYQKLRRQFDPDHDRQLPPVLSPGVDYSEDGDDGETASTLCDSLSLEQPPSVNQGPRRLRRWPSSVHEAIAVIGILSFVLFVDLISCSPLFYCHRLDATPRRLYATKTSYDDVRSLREDNAETKAQSQLTWDRRDTFNSEDDDVVSAEDDEMKKKMSCATFSSTMELYRLQNDSVAAVNRLLNCHQSSVSTEKKDDCQPVSFYILARHGTRYNKLSNMNGMAEKLYKIRTMIESQISKGTMCDEDLNWLRSWKPRHTIQDGSKLSTTGWNEIFRIGQRYGDLFPSVLRQNYIPSLYEFRYTNYTGKGDRTKQSARAFAQGLWGKFENVEMIENSRPDWLLQFYEHCHKYLRVVSGHPVEDYEKFKTGPEMAKVINDVNKRLGLPENTIGFSDVYLIFEACRLEHGLYRDSPWCSVLTPSMLEVIEYHQDVKYYWEDGYGHSISYEPACTLIDDILQHLEDETKLGRFRFAHSGTLDALYTRIGLFEDEQPLRANNFDHHRSHRQWATSRSTPMSANIAFVKFRCLHPPMLRVKTIVNEDIRHPVTIPGCLASLCPLETIRSLWQPIASNCDINRICEQMNPTTDRLQRTRDKEMQIRPSSTINNSSRDILPLW